MTDKKTITINPELFKINKTKKQRSSSIPTISPSLKSKFLKKMSNSKNQRLKKEKMFIQDPLETNDFENSIQYLSNLIEKEKEVLHNKSIKQPHDIPVSTELAIELKEEILPEPAVSSNISLNYKVDNEVGYGCLKNGLKPNYRTWIKTKKAPLPLPEKEEIKKTSFSNENSYNESVIPKTFTPTYEKEDEIKIMDIPTKKEIISIPKKELIKKTIKKNYTLGKSKKHRKIGVLLKNTTIKQKVLDAHKELKKTNIKEVKKYLTKAGLVKIGSTAPVDVLKELYESAKLTGEVLNSNKETLLHNFINENNIE
jgi:hypothetical protein